ncbi:hypothetical protein C8J57DRAFT_1713764 [Mycena rebaudengoi]|nr:hypothetical protein C8J57DRAFT_1713764 [Mycena rebaudengoi]
MPFFQPTVPPLYESLSFSGRTALVTGANSGLGFAAALHYAQRHAATLIIAVRDRDAGEAARAIILADPVVRARKSPPTIIVYELDLARPSSVASFGAKIIAEVPFLHILLLNAGIGTLGWKTTPETGSEQMFQVNYLSNALLESHAASYITIVGSRMQGAQSFSAHPIPPATTIAAFLNDRANFIGVKRYADSKALVSMWEQKLAARVDAAEVTVNNVCPGMVTTGIDKAEHFLLRGMVAGVQMLRGRTAEVGGRILVCATAAGRETHGELLGDFTVVPPNKFFDTEQGREMQQKLWVETLAAAEDMAPGSVQAANLN